MQIGSKVIYWGRLKCRTGNEGQYKSKTDRHNWKMRYQITRVGKYMIGKCETGMCRMENAERKTGWKMQGRQMPGQVHFVK